MSAGTGRATDPRAEKLDETLKLRLAARDKELIARAARLAGEKPSAFIRASVMREAEQIVQAHEHTILPAADHDAFRAALASPPEPTEAAVAAARRSRRRMKHAG
ncbi:type II toxin-antitoxin system TacA family antitoxin [Marinicauda salina]|nr:DUF1778 domain-containing protein [Marinicauda salina]